MYKVNLIITIKTIEWSLCITAAMIQFMQFNQCLAIVFQQPGRMG